MSDKHYVGLGITGFEDHGTLKPVSRVTLQVDDETVLTAGDDSGYEITASCPHATQAMVNNLLASLRGSTYQMYTADDAGLDPAAELGDGVTVAGVYSVVSKISDDGEGYPGISAPGEEELEDEYPSGGPMTQAFNKKIATTRSLISKTAEEIRLEVRNEADGLSSSITQTAEKIETRIDNEVKGLNSSIEQTASSIRAEVKSEVDNLSTSFELDLNGLKTQVNGIDGSVSTLEQTATSLQTQINAANGNYSSIKQTVDGIYGEVYAFDYDRGEYRSRLEQTMEKIELSVENGTESSTITLSGGGITAQSKTIQFTGEVLFKNELDEGTTSINGNWIRTGKISALRLELGGEMTVYESLNEDDQNYRYNAGSLGYVESSDYSGDPTYGIGMRTIGWIDDDRTANEVVITDGGARITCQRWASSLRGQRISEVVAAKNISLLTENKINASTDITVTSDQRRKEAIEYDVAQNYLPILEKLKPVSFLYRAPQKGGRHLGFIAQDVVSALEELGLPVEDLNMVSQDENGYYGLCYNEFIPLLVAKVQQLEKEMEELRTWKS